MKRVLTIMILIMVILMMAATPADAKKKHRVKAVKGKQVVCPYCIDGTHHDCPYWYIDGQTREEKHMTPGEIEEFLEMEMR